MRINIQRNIVVAIYSVRHHLNILRYVTKLIHTTLRRFMYAHLLLYKIFINNCEILTSVIYLTVIDMRI